LKDWFLIKINFARLLPFSPDETSFSHETLYDVGRVGMRVTRLFGRDDLIMEIGGRIDFRVLAQIAYRCGPEDME